MKRSLRLLLLASPLLVGGLLYVIFQSTDPSSIGPGGVLGVFILIYIGCLSILFIILRFGLYWAKRLLVHRDQAMARSSDIGARKAYYIASVFAFAPVTLLAMHAYSQLQLTDVALVGLLIALTVFYIVRRG